MQKSRTLTARSSCILLQLPEGEFKPHGTAGLVVLHQASLLIVLSHLSGANHGEFQLSVPHVTLINKPVHDSSPCAVQGYCTALYTPMIGLTMLREMVRPTHSTGTRTGVQGCAIFWQHGQENGGNGAHRSIHTDRWSSRIAVCMSDGYYITS